MSGAEILMDRPPGGWGDLVTNHTLDLRFAAWEERFDHKVDALEARMDLRFAAVDARFAAVDHNFDLLRAEMREQGADLRAEMDRRIRAQTWTMLSAFTGLMAVMVAAIRL